MRASTKIWLAALCLSSFLIALAVAFGVFESMPHLEDEFAQLFQAKIFASGRLSVPETIPPLAFQIPFSVSYGGQLFGKYPPGYAWILAVGVLVGAPWLVNALAAAAGVLGVFALGRDLFDEATGLLAAGLGAISPSFVILSGSLLPHTLELALLAWFGWAILRARRAATLHRMRYAFLAGLLVGLALAVRPLTAAAVGLPFALVALADVIRAPKTWLPVYLRALGGFALPVALWGAYNWAVTGWPFTNTYTLYWPYDSLGFGAQHGLYGHTLASGLYNVRVDLVFFTDTALGWPTWFKIPTLWVVAVIGLALPKRSRWEPFLLAPLGLLAVAQVAYWTRSAGLYGARYYAEVMPFVWILCARGLLKLERWVEPRIVVQALLPLWMAWSIGHMLVPRFAEGRGLYGLDRADARLVQAAGLQKALVFVSTRDWSDYARLSWLNEPVLADGAMIFARNLGKSGNAGIAEQFPGWDIYTFDRLRRPQLQACPQPCAIIQAPQIDYNGLNLP